MDYPRQSHPWQAYATQLPDASPTMGFPYPSPPYPQYVPNRPPSPSQVNPYSPELQASPGLSDAQYSFEGSVTTPELDPTGPSSFDSPYSSLFPVTTPQSDFSPLDASVGLDAMECPADPSVRPDHTVNNMIKAALRDSPSGKLPSREIVKAIQARFPFYKKPDHQQKLSNTIRHHLSNSKGFVKLPKDASMRGKGDYWTYDPEAAQASRGAGIDVPESSSVTGASHRRSPSASASSPYPLPRHRGPDGTIVQRSAATRSSRGVGPIRVSPKVRPTTRLALPDDRLPSNPRLIRPSAGTLTGPRLGLQPGPSHGLWSPRPPISSVPSTPEQQGTVLDVPRGLMQRDVADQDGFVHTSFLSSPTPVIASSPSSNMSSPIQLPLPQLSGSQAQNSIFQVSASNEIHSFYNSSTGGMLQPSFSAEFPNVEEMSRLYLNLESTSDFPSFN
ncbi:hypothetical protein FS837_004438 [Tulasnella sp. UAMH 9824]|nr:hypothetical protein FS837_004438 [Tulasnella sp. UAMH 9824]